MTVALTLALHAVCGVTVLLQPQDVARDVRWPTHAVVTVPQGWIRSTDAMSMLENGQPMNAQIEVVARWPDGSPKWLHAYAAYRYAAGKPATYEFEKRAPPGHLPPSPLQVVDGTSGITVRTGQIEFTVPRPFAGITLARHGDQKLIDGPGGPELVDQRGLSWQARLDETAEVVVEQQGPAQVTIKASGWYQNSERRVAPFCRFVTRISAFADSPLVKFDHATIFADDMRQHAVSELSFRFAIPGVTAYGSSLSRGAFDDMLSAIFFTQVSADRVFTLSQRGADNSGPIDSQSSDERCAGWFTARTADREITLLTKDFWQKCPKEVRIGADGITYYAWPRHAELAKSADTATRPEEVYKFQCFHSGPLLDSRLPNDYFAALEQQTDTSECKAVYARAANLEGVAVHNEFALVLAPPASADSAAPLDAARWQMLYTQNPIARVSPTAVAVSGVLGPVAAGGNDFSDVERAVHDGMIGYARSIPRYDDYGWAIYGNTHSEEWMNPLAAGTPAGRPSLHRVWNNNHYQHVSTSWRLAALDGDPEMLDWARLCTDYYASIGQVRYDGLRGRVDGQGKQIAGPSVKYHNPGAFWHCKAFVPWGCRDYGMDSNDDDSGLTGHWPDPTGLLLAWLFDANRWARDGYDLWLDRVKFPTGGTRREINTTLVHAITAHEYRPNEQTLAAIRGMAKGLSSVPLVQQRPGPLWEPTWLSRYHELMPNDEAFNKYLVESADAVGVGIEGIWSLALSATAYDITRDEKYLRQHAGTLARSVREVFYDSAPDKRWDKYGFGPGPDRDSHFMLQWPRFHAALRDAKIESLPTPDEPGNYFCAPSRFDNLKDIQARGTKILIAPARPSTTLNLQATTLAGGSIHATLLQVTSPANKTILDLPRLPMSASPPKVTQIRRASTWEVATEQYPLATPETGLYTVSIGSHQIGLFQPLTDQVECQVLRNAKLSAWSDSASNLAKLARGYLLPLTSGPIELVFTAMGTSDGSYIALENSQRQPLLKRHIRAGDSASVVLNRSQATRGPWLLDAFSDHTGFFRLTINASVDEPLLFGRRLEDLQQIQRRLANGSR